ncbi:hypothetical protein B0T13DRAFT_199436 [Neurospora crassa]|nr:hypothetical protein B0T13DRAFT_199436 [Neurospora crassa]
MLRRYLADCTCGVQKAGTPLVGPHLISPGLHNAGATFPLVVPCRTWPRAGPDLSTGPNLVALPSSALSSSLLRPFLDPPGFVLSLITTPTLFHSLHNTAFFLSHVFSILQIKGVTPPVAFSVPKQHRAAASAGLFSPLLSFQKYNWSPSIPILCNLLPPWVRLPPHINRANRN